MTNTYANNPTKGLSTLQKTILLWARNGYDTYMADGHAGFVMKHGASWDNRPPFAGEGATSQYTHGDARGRRGNKGKRKQAAEPAAASRALKRLEDRGLIERVLYNGRTTGVRLTDAGREAAGTLQNG